MAPILIFILDLCYALYWEKAINFIKLDIAEDQIHRGNINSEEESIHSNDNEWKGGT